MTARIIFLLSIIFVVPINADISSPSHFCSKPFIPDEFSDQYQIDNFKYEVERYKQCINDFIDEMNDASEKHQDAAKKAIDEWNSFVNSELN